MLKSVQCMFADKKGNIWFGSRNNGLGRYDGKICASFLETKKYDTYEVTQLKAI